MAKVVNTPDLFPASCLLCGVTGEAPDRKYWMDVEKYAEDWGNIYFCNFCFEYMIREVDPNFGIDPEISPDEELEVLRAKVEHYESILRPISSSDIAGNDTGGTTSVGVIETRPKTRRNTKSKSAGDAEVLPESSDEPESTPQRTTGEDANAVLVGFGSDEQNVPGDSGDSSVSFVGESEPFRGSLGSLPVIASEFGVDEGPDTGFKIGI